LGLEHREYERDTLHLNNHEIFDDQVDPVFTERSSFVKRKRGNPDLASVTDAQLVQLYAQRAVVERFEEAGSETTMHLDGRPDDALGVVELFELCGSVV
jgi:hypothetical protein